MSAQVVALHPRDSDRLEDAHSVIDEQRAHGVHGIMVIAFHAERTEDHGHIEDACFGDVPLSDLALFASLLSYEIGRRMAEASPYLQKEDG